MESEEPQVGRTCSEVAMEPHQEICIIGSDRSKIATSAVRQHHFALKLTWIVRG